MKVAGGEDYEVTYLAKEADITVEQARELIRRFGDDRETLMDEARRQESLAGTSRRP